MSERNVDIRVRFETSDPDEKHLVNVVEVGEADGREIWRRAHGYMRRDVVGPWMDERREQIAKDLMAAVKKIPGAQITKTGPLKGVRS